MATEEKKKKPTMEEYLKEGKITQDLYDTVAIIPKDEKKARVIETLHRRIAAMGGLPSLGQVTTTKKKQ